jgi:hypothetical protein
VAKHLKSMVKFLEKGEELAEKGFPEESLNNLRKFWEAALKELGEKYECWTSNENQKTFSKLRKHLPARLYYYLQHIQSMGNYGSHFQEDGVEPSVEDARYCIYAGQELLQWINPSVYKDPVDAKTVFIENIAEAVSCQQCEQPIGSGCLKKNGHPTAKNCEHTVRKKAYASYRRDFQKHYRTTLVDAMHEMVADIGLSHDGIINSGQITSWFKNRYPAYNKKSVGAHTRLMTTNMAARNSYTLSESKDYNLFFRLESGVYRLYDSSKDPAPVGI